jgi:hypothetical protein
VKQNGVWIIPPLDDDLLTPGERSFLSDHPNKDFSKPALPFPCTYKNQEAVNRLDTLVEKHTQSATQAQPAQNENGQAIESLPAFLTMVPKAGLEPAWA